MGNNFITSNIKRGYKPKKLFNKSMLILGPALSLKYVNKNK